MYLQLTEKTHPNLFLALHADKQFWLPSSVVVFSVVKDKNNNNKTKLFKNKMI